MRQRVLAGQPRLGLVGVGDDDRGMGVEVGRGGGGQRDLGHRQDGPPSPVAVEDGPVSAGRPRRSNSAWRSRTTARSPASPNPSRGGTTEGVTSPTHSSTSVSPRALSRLRKVIVTARVVERREGRVVHGDVDPVIPRVERRPRGLRTRWSGRPSRGSWTRRSRLACRESANSQVASAAGAALTHRRAAPRSAASPSGLTTRQCSAVAPGAELPGEAGVDGRDPMAHRRDEGVVRAAGDAGLCQGPTLGGPPAQKAVDRLSRALRRWSSRPLLRLKIPMGHSLAGAGSEGPETMDRRG